MRPEQVPPAPWSFRTARRDVQLLFATRGLRLFGYGFLSVVLVLYLAGLGLTEPEIGALLTMTLVGDTGVSLWLTTRADRIGRRRTLMAGAGLMVMAGALFVATGSFWLLVLAATIGVISPSGNEIGPFLPIEQAALAQELPSAQRTEVFAWYNLAGSMTTALGALAGGCGAQALQWAGLPAVASYRAVVLAYGVVGFGLLAMFRLLSPAVEAPPAAVTAPVAGCGKPNGSWGLGRSRGVVLRLSALFALDAFAGGFVIQSIVAYWFHARFGAEPALLGAIFFGANIVAGLSSLSAAWVARRVGLINTMVLTHLPSNVLLMLVPLMPALPWAIAVLLLRFSISQMDVPTRQSYTMAVVEPEERSAAAGVTGIARTLGASLAPVFVGPMLASPVLMSVPFFLSGGLKIVYDLLLYASFRAEKPPEEGGEASR
ncbi:MAG: MFS transporter [Candidatus Riflebacteria bacterium]|nr:MFS transporter [Candidatus Riflebacteria bacterium]